MENPNTATKGAILLVNDDGVDSPLLWALVDRFAQLGEVVVAAPAEEQSWVSKRMSRFEKVKVLPRRDFSCAAYSISGSPADCVNLALQHLLDAPPRAIVSGINVGHNAGLAYILSSGTIGAALEGALHGAPSFAASMALARDDYDRMKGDPQALGERLGAKATQAADILARFVEETLAKNENPYAVVHSLNFPSSSLEGARVVRARPALTQSNGFFQKEGERYGFVYRDLPENRPAQPSDRETLISGHVSYTRLDFSQLGSDLA